MDRTIYAAIDHLSILNYTLHTSTDVFFALGFVREGGKTALDQNVFEMMVPSSRFVFDNAYIECVQFPPSVSEFYGYLNSPAGVHIIALLTPDAEQTRLRLQERGICIDELERATRKNFDYGEKKGTAVLLLVPIPQEIIRRTHVAFLEHVTRDLIYQPTRYRHLNGVNTLEGVVVCCRSDGEADRMEAELTDLCALAENARCEGGARSMRLMDPDSIRREYGVTVNPDGSDFAVLCFGAPDLAPLRAILSGSSYLWSEDGGRILVNLQDSIGMAFEFRQV